MSETANNPFPMRAGLFERWLTIWHTLYIGGLLVTLAVALWDTRAAWGREDAALVIIVAALIALYLRVVVFATRWPHPLWFLVAYYSLVIALFVIAVYLNPIFLYALGMLFGQMFGVLPPVLVIPGVLSVIGVFVLAAEDWRLPREVSWSSVLLIGAQVGLMLLLYLYVYHLIRTSQERAQLVRELEAAKEDLERAKDQEAELAVLRERERLARDLHDGLGHALTALTVQLEAVQRLYPVDPVRASARIDEMKALARESMDGLRRAIEGLRSPGLGERPLPDALGDLCAGTAERTGLRVACDCAPDARALRPAVAEALWRVTQEALTNIERHAGANRAVVALALDEDAARLLVADDGAGLPPDAERRPGHYGLRGMRERIEGLGGALIFGPGLDGRGTAVRATVPH